MFHNKKIAIFMLLVGCTLICASQIEDDFKTDGNFAVHASTVRPDPDIGKKTTKSTTSTSTTTTSTTAAPPTTTSTEKSTTTTTSTTTTPETTTAGPTTTPAPITSTPAPTPYPDPEVGVWNASCIMIKMAAQLNFTYTTKENKTKRALYNIPKTAVVDHALCDNLTQSIQLNWGPDTAQQSFLMQFDNVDKSVTVSMIKIVLTLLNDTFPDAKEPTTIQFIHRGNEFVTPIKMSYHCTTMQHFNFTETIGNETINGTMNIHDVQVEAFRDGKSNAFSTVHDCASSETSDVVPIAVGIALVALILIVLISYLCARRRSTSRGYMSF